MTPALAEQGALNIAAMIVCVPRRDFGQSPYSATPGLKLCH